jgi:hypothetical protein
MDDHEEISPENIPTLVGMLHQLTAINAEIVGQSLGTLHAEVIKDHGCAFASNLILQVSANVFTSTLAYVVSHRHKDGMNYPDQKVLSEIHEKLTEFIGDAMKQYGTREGATIISIELGKKLRKEPS